MLPLLGVSGHCRTEEGAMRPCRDTRKKTCKKFLYKTHSVTLIRGTYEKGNELGRWLGIRKESINYLEETFEVKGFG